MGGPGSGNWWRWDKRDTTDEHRSIDVRQWARDGWLAPGRHFWSLWKRGEQVTGSIGVTVAGRPGAEAEHLVLDYRCRVGVGEWEDVRQTVWLEWTACHYGGRRPWFCCPSCGRRVALLYGAGVYFACRRCYRLVYESQRERPMDTHRRRAQRIRARLGGEPVVDTPFPPKPRGMHWRTYLRLWRACMAAERAYDAAFWVKYRNLDALLDRLGDPLD